MNLNTVYKIVQLTKEQESGGKLPFLDSLIIRPATGSLGRRTVYRKATHTDIYPHKDSHHHPIQKRGVMLTLLEWAWCIADKEHWKEES